MTLILTAIHVLACLALVFVVLLQKSAGDMGAAFGGTSQSLFGARGSGSFLGKLTAVLAATFMITSLSLAFFTSHGSRKVSIMDGKTAQSAPVTPGTTTDGPPVPAKVAPVVPVDQAPPITGSKPIPLPSPPAPVNGDQQGEQDSPKP